MLTSSRIFRARVSGFYFGPKTPARTLPDIETTVVAGSRTGVTHQGENHGTVPVVYVEISATASRK